MTTPAMQFCLLQDIPVFLLSSRGRYYGLSSPRPRTRFCCTATSLLGLPTPPLHSRLRQRLRALVDTRCDHIRWYPLCRPCHRRVVQQGQGPIPMDEGFYVV